MKLNRADQSGGTSATILLTGMAIAILVIFGIKYYDDHQNDVVIHPPHIDVH
ncbi:MAG TPA: hypothetical protein VN963_07075 [bacterium]|nr:hypothetical protein [bacterium]